MKRHVLRGRSQKRKKEKTTHPGTIRYMRKFTRAMKKGRFRSLLFALSFKSAGTSASPYRRAVTVAMGR